MGLLAWCCFALVRHPRLAYWTFPRALPRGAAGDLLACCSRSSAAPAPHLAYAANVGFGGAIWKRVIATLCGYGVFWRCSSPRSCCAPVEAGAPEALPAASQGAGRDRPAGLEEARSLAAGGGAVGRR